MNDTKAAFKMPESFNGYLAPYPLRSPSIDEMRMMIGLQLMKVSDEQLEQDLAPKLERETAYQVLNKRLAFYKVPVEIRVRLICAQMCSNFGECVIMAWTLAKLYAEHRRKITMDDLFMGPFAEGFPDLENKEAGRKLWDSQKGFNNGQECDNLIDVAPWPHQ